MTLHLNTLSVDSRDPAAMAGFWSQALDWFVLMQSYDQALIAPTQSREELPGAVAVPFLRNEDPKTDKNRWHFDLAPDDQDHEVARLEGLGARRTDVGQHDVTWVVMADPEGNMFCMLHSLPATGEHRRRL